MVEVGQRPENRSYTFTVVDKDAASKVTVQGTNEQIQAWQKAVGSDDHLSLDEAALMFHNNLPQSSSEVVTGLQRAVGDRAGVRLRTQDLNHVAETLHEKMHSDRTVFMQTANAARRAFQNRDAQTSGQALGDAVDVIRNSGLPIEDQVRLLRGLSAVPFSAEHPTINGRHSNMNESQPGTAGAECRRVLESVVASARSSGTVLPGSQVREMVDERSPAPSSDR